MPNLILLEDEPVMAGELHEFLGDCGYDVTLVHDLAGFARAFEPVPRRLAPGQPSAAAVDGQRQRRCLPAPDRRSAGRRLVQL
ncbi:hypothetical protein [Pseudomonas sp. 5P_5.1_Bac1]|uniref:hypothetical protein n=1 Tax=Pseudomonas sp. 5P_5.1_Bac1 TaxID=2971616 RepID=UPI0021CAAC66|nr:hypothetical protein [Pseudomonas sp. 5P_5.1_Bac1]MCU1724773.1 hypothetical protein [Pseudomonas sp. 5P_5.1_Bac1]